METFQNVRWLKASDGVTYPAISDLQMKFPSQKPAGAPEPRRRDGFTLIELLVAVSIVGVLAALLLPALARAKNSGHVTTCLNNLRQLQLVWTMYADDHSGRLVPNKHVYGPPHPSLYSWVQGRMDYLQTNPMNTNSGIFLDPQLSAFANYIKSPRVYRCPSDRSAIKLGNNWHSRVRSYGMSWALASERTKEIRVLNKYSEINTPAPASLFVFIDQHPDYIADIHFHLTLETGASANFMDLPSGNHNGSGALTFADGHAERRKWADQRTLVEVKYHAAPYLAIRSPNNPDIAWLQGRYAIPKQGK